ncbi:hypothetical protein XENOCAPTIV_007188, partial [Xenoophorus captivus]
LEGSVLFDLKSSQSKSTLLCIFSSFAPHLPFLSCSASCGDGVQRREVFCQVGDRRSPAETGCVQRSRPASSQSCRVADCPSRYRWREGDWQAVSLSGCQDVLNHKVYKPKQVVSPFCLTWHWTDVLRHLW